MPRLFGSIVIILLPLAEGLSALQLMSIITGLHVLALVWETIGGLQRGADIYERWGYTGPPREAEPELEKTA